MIFEPILSTDLEEICKLQPEGWSDIITDIEFYIKSNFCIPIKTCRGGKIVGIGATLLFKDTAWLAHIIVDSKYRKQGIGLAIVNELLQINKAKNIQKTLLLATNIGLPIYQNNELKGYYIPNLGEGPIIAINTEVGIELMKLKYNNTVKAVIPEQNKAAIKFLRYNGFVLSSTSGTRMIQGEPINWKPENIFGRIGGNFG